jgi:hypothetical protein
MNECDVFSASQHMADNEIFEMNHANLVSSTAPQTRDI